MSKVLSFRCRCCEHTFSREYGINVRGTGTFYCQRCGAAHPTDLSGGWVYEAICACGGTVDESALGRCPACGKMLLAEDLVSTAE